MRISRFIMPVFLLALLLFAAGCGQKLPAKDALKAATQQQATLNSYRFAGNLTLRVDSKSEVLNRDPNAKLFLQALKNTKIAYHGSTSVDPMQTELILDATVPLQDISLNFTMPIVMNQDKLWVKIPALSMVPELNHLAGKYVEIDYKELSKLSGQPVSYTVNTKAQRELSAKIIDIFFKDLGNDYFTDVKKEEAALPSDVTADQVVKFQLTNDTLEPFAKTFLGTTLPQIIDTISQSELSKEINMTPEQATQAKSELQTAIKELEANKDWKKTVQIKKADWLFGVEKGGISYQKGDVDLTLTPPDQSGTLDFGFTLDQKITNKNTPPKWEIGTPKAEEVIKFMELFGQMMANR